MENEKDSNDDVYFEEIIKKTKTGITIAFDVDSSNNLHLF